MNYRWGRQKHRRRSQDSLGQLFSVDYFHKRAYPETASSSSRDGNFRFWFRSLALPHSAIGSISDKQGALANWRNRIAIHLASLSIDGQEPRRWWLYCALALIPFAFLALVAWQRQQSITRCEVCRLCIAKKLWKTTADHRTQTDASVACYRYCAIGLQIDLKIPSVVCQRLSFPADRIHHTPGH